MTNYIKSECYRTLRTKWVYGIAAILSGLILLYHLAVWLLAAFTPDFRYGTASFSYSNLVSQPMIYCLAAFLITAVLYEGEHRYGTCKNAVAYGISRTNIFLGKCIVSLAACFAILVPVMAVYITSASLFLPKGGPVTLLDLLMEIPAVSLVAVSALVLGVFVLEMFDRNIIGILVWYLILFGIPKVLFLLSMKLEFLSSAAFWMPANFFSNAFSPQMAVRMSECSVIWDTPLGMAKCLAAGAIGIFLFGILGILALRKKDI